MACGGGITARAASLLPFSLDPFVEQVVDEVELGFRYPASFVRSGREPLVLMTERIRLDAFLVSRAVEAGAVFRDDCRVEAVDVDGADATVRTREGSVGAGR
jgi:flavin-dependent dehydrogenase